MRAPTLARPRPKPGPGRPADPSLPARRREQILRRAARLFARRGYAGTDLQVVADSLGLGKATIYRYFPSKRALFQGAVDRVMSGMRAAVDAAAADVPDPIERVGRAVHAYLEYFGTRPESVELLIQEWAHFRERRTPTYFAYRQANVGRWRDVYRSLIAEGRIRDLPVERITDVLGDLAYGTMFANHMARRPAGHAEQAAAIMDIVFRGLLTEKPA